MSALRLIGQSNSFEAIAGLGEALAQLPDVEIRASEVEVRVRDRTVDAVVQGKVKGRPVRFLVELTANAYPRDVLSALRQIASLRQVDETAADIPMVVAPAITESAREILRNHEVGYWDPGGSLYFSLPWATYLVDRPVPARRPRVLRNVYRGSSAQVLHALLLNPDREWHVGELARTANVSPSTAHQVCEFLGQEAWLESSGRGPRTVRVLKEPGAVLDAWADAHSLAEYQVQRYHRWTREPSDLLRIVTDALTTHGVEYALTLGSGAQLVAPHGTSTDTASALVPQSAVAKLARVAEEAGLALVDEGESLTVYVTRDKSPLLFARQVEGFCVASDVQLYLDLWAWPRRGKEQAKHLRAERLKY
jgi:hypothetical protein